MDRPVNDLLAETDTSLLKEYARKKNVLLSNDATQADIIEALLKSLGEAEIRKDLFLTPTRLELRQIEERLKQLVIDSAKQPTEELPEKLQQVIVVDKVRELPVDLGSNLNVDTLERLDRFRRAINARLKGKVSATLFQKELDLLGGRVDMERSQLEKNAEDAKASLALEIDRVRTELSTRAEEGKIASDQRFGDMNKRFDEGKSAADKRFDDMNKRFDDIGKGTQHLQWMFGSFAVLLTIVAGIATFFGGKQFTNIQDMVTNFQKTQVEVAGLQKELSQTNKDQKKAIDDLGNVSAGLNKQSQTETDLFISYTEFFVQVMWDDCQHNLEGISLSSLDAKAFDSISRNNAIIIRILKASKTYSVETTEEIKIVRIFQRVNDGVLAYRRFLNAQKDKGAKSQALEALVKAWDDKLTNELVSGGKYALMRQQLDAYWRNVRGIIEIQKYYTDPDAYSTSLDEADRFFDAAVSDRDVLFARPYNSKTIVIDCRLDKLPNKPESFERMIGLITDARNLLREASKYPASSRSQSITYNNIASWHFRECNVRLDLEKVLNETGIATLLKEGDDAVNKALSQPNRVATAFVTRADLGCAKIKFLKKIKPASDCKDELNKVLNDIDTAVKEGYSGFEQYNGEQLLTAYPHYRVLLEIDNPEQVKQRLFQVTGVRAK